MHVNMTLFRFSTSYVSILSDTFQCSGHLPAQPSSCPSPIWKHLRQVVMKMLSVRRNRGKDSRNQEKNGVCFGSFLRVSSMTEKFLMMGKKARDTDLTDSTASAVRFVTHPFTIRRFCQCTKPKLIKPATFLQGTFLVRP